MAIWFILIVRNILSSFSTLFLARINYLYAIYHEQRACGLLYRSFLIILCWIALLSDFARSQDRFWSAENEALGGLFLVHLFAGLDQAALHVAPLSIHGQNFYGEKSKCLSLSV